MHLIKKLLALTVAALAVMSFAATSIAGDGCGGGGDKTEEGSSDESAQS